MNYLVTGGTGFIGKALCREILRRGHHVCVLSRDAAHARRQLPAEVRVIGQLHELGEPDALINLAGANLGDVRWNAPRKQAFIDSRVQTTQALVEYLRQCSPKPRVLISGSAIGWYGARPDEPLTENSPSGEHHEYQTQLCKQWESAALQAEALGVRVCRVRIGIVLESDGGPLAKMLPPFRMGLGGPMGDGRQFMSWIHRADLIALMLAMTEQAQWRGAYNATAPKPVTNREFSRALGRALQRPAVVPMPAAVLRLLIGEMANLLLTGQRVLPQRALDAGFRFQYPDLESALQHILRPRASA